MPSTSYLIKFKFYHEPCWGTTPPPPLPKKISTLLLGNYLPLHSFPHLSFHTNRRLFHLSTNYSSTNSIRDVCDFSVSSLKYFFLAICTIYQNFPHNGKFLLVHCRLFPLFFSCLLSAFSPVSTDLLCPKLHFCQSS